METRLQREPKSKGKIHTFVCVFSDILCRSCHHHHSQNVESLHYKDPLCKRTYFFTGKFNLFVFTFFFFCHESLEILKWCRTDFLLLLFLHLMRQDLDSLPSPHSWFYWFDFLLYHLCFSLTILFNFTTTASNDLNLTIRSLVTWILCLPLLKFI